MKNYISDFKAISGQRWDANFHLPELVELEDKVKKISSKTLADFVLDASGGATPSTKDPNNYRDASDGIPFVRVQNLTVNGVLSTGNLRYINPEIHESYLGRSKISGGDLLVKITGVGRMAVASVVPDGFVGNINQHIVRIKTESKGISEILASYLNLDFVERIATKRSTGGTRPALDYAALLGIPVIFDEEIHKLASNANHNYLQKIKSANDVLSSIEPAFLDAIGVTVPESCLNTKLDERVFVKDFRSLAGIRWNPTSHWRKLNFTSTKFDLARFDKHVLINPSTKINFSDESTKVSFVPMSAVDETEQAITDAEEREIADIKGYTVFQDNDVIWAKITPCMENGKCAIAKDLLNGIGFGSTEFHVFRATGSIIPEYLHAIVGLKILRNDAALNFTGTSGHQRVDAEYFRLLNIPLPSIDEQKEIIARINTIKHEAISRIKDAENELHIENKRIEAMIFKNQ